MANSANTTVTQKTTDITTVGYMKRQDIEAIVAQRLHETETRINRVRDEKGHRKERKDTHQGHYYLVVEFVFAIVLITHADLPVWALVGLTVPDVIQWGAVDIMRMIRWMGNRVRRMEAENR